MGKLGFSLTADYRFGGQNRFVVVAPPDGTALVALIAPAAGSDQEKFIGRDGQVVFVSDDLGRQYETWLERGVRFHHEPRPASWGGVYTTFEDVDGNSFFIVSWDEIAKEVETKRRATAARAEAERRAAQELEIAKQVQARLFPQAAPELKTLEYAGICMQARDVGGDYYDFLNLGSDRLGLVIGDISGKGMGAALLMANLQANLRSQFALALEQPQRFLEGVNELFYQNTVQSAYATLFFAEYDDRTGRIRYANCGHLAALLIRSNGAIERLESTSTVLGLFKDWDCVFSEATLSAGDAVVIYTDGVTESFNEADEEFGEQRLIDAILRHRELRPEELMRAVMEDVRQFGVDERQDDITLIVAKRRTERAMISS